MSILPLDPIYRDFWRDQEKALLKEVQACETGSIRGTIANQFYLAAAHQVRLLIERDGAIILGYPHYIKRANQIAAQFDRRLS